MWGFKYGLVIYLHNLFHSWISVGTSRGERLVGAHASFATEFISALFMYISRVVKML